MNSQGLTLFAIPDNITTLAIIIALFAVFMGILAVVVWSSVSFIITRYPELPPKSNEETAKAIDITRRKLLVNTFIIDGAILTSLLALIILLINSFATN